MFFRMMIALIALTLASGPGVALEPAQSGVVIIHGKWSSSTELGALRDELEEAGFLVEAPEMPWSGRRLFDKPFFEALLDIDAAIARLEAKGRPNVVLIGHSLGSVAALAHAARGGKALPQVLIAPGHFPEGIVISSRAADSVAKARGMVAEGKGDEVASFLSLNSGDRSRTIRTAAASYLSYYDPGGPAAMSLIAPKVAMVPTLWVAPSNDPLTAAFDRLVRPKLPAGLPLVRADVVADHMSSPTDGRRVIVSWLKALAKD